MLRKIWSSLSYANVMSTIALVAALGTGTAYAANTVFSTDIVDGEVKHADIASNSVTSTNIYPGSVTNTDIHTGAVDSVKVLDESLTSSDLATDSVQATELADGAVTNAKIGEEAVTSTKIGDGAVTNFKLGAGVVTHSKLGANSIDGSNVAADSHSLADILGANASGSISFSRSANTCGTLTLGVSGAQVGQVVLFSFTGATAVPTSVVFGGTKVTAANTVEVKACNVGATNVTVSNLGIRVVTFG